MTQIIKTQKQYREICFTSFNIDIDWFKDWTKVDKTIVQYIIIQGELTKDGKKHIQGYTQFTGQKRMEQIKKFFGDNALHIEKTLGTAEQASNYCKQEKNGVFKNYEEYGEMIIKQSGRRTDLIELRNRIANGETIRQIQLNTSNSAELHLTIQYGRQLKELETKIREERFINNIKKEFENITWKPFQQLIIDEVNKIADNRKIKWIYDETGNSGKSFLARYLMTTKDIYYITGGKQTDILYGYENQPIIIYDLARTYADNLEHIYTTIENFKNGMYLSTKYETKTKIFNIPHIIVMANFEPNIEKLSKDRWDIIQIDNDKIINKNIEEIDNNIIDNHIEHIEDIIEIDSGNETDISEEHHEDNQPLTKSIEQIQVEHKNILKSIINPFHHELYLDRYEWNKYTRKFWDTLDAVWI